MDGAMYSGVIFWRELGVVLLAASYGWTLRSLLLLVRSTAKATLRVMRVAEMLWSHSFGFASWALILPSTSSLQESWNINFLFSRQAGHPGNNDWGSHDVRPDIECWEAFHKLEPMSNTSTECTLFKSKMFSSRQNRCRFATVMMRSISFSAASGACPSFESIALAPRAALSHVSAA